MLSSSTRHLISFSLLVGLSLTTEKMAEEFTRCREFEVGDPAKMEFYSPNYPGLYPNKTDCYRLLQAPAGHQLRLDFRDQFVLEVSDECRFDYLEVRDGAHGYSRLIGQYCGQAFPPMITSSGRNLWLRFHSDENIEYSGFRAVYSHLPKQNAGGIVNDLEACRIEKTGIEGYVNKSDIGLEHVQHSLQHGVPLDCVWIITVQQGWRIQLYFNKFQLEVPNDCESNFVDVFGSRTDIPSRLHNFCGSMAESVLSPSNVLQLRFLAEPRALSSNFEALFTAFREKPKGGSCEPELYDCEDGNCINLGLKCNGRINCRFRWDEDQLECQTKGSALSNMLNREHMVIILIVFFFILSAMCFAFLYNCFRKLAEDHRLIQEQRRRVRECQEMGLKRSGSTVMTPLGFNKTSSTECYVPAGCEVILVPGNGEVTVVEEELTETRDSQCQTQDPLFIPAPASFTTFGYDSPEEPAPDVIMTH